MTTSLTHSIAIKEHGMKKFTVARTVVPAQFAKMTTITTIVTPEMAAEWLKRNKTNRVIRPLWISEIVVMIKTGKWLLTHQGIAFDEEGFLIDGQHRLMAIVETGISVPMQVTTDSGAATFEVVDTGKTRNMADLTRTPKLIAEVTTRLARFVCGYSSVDVYDVKKAKKAFGDTVELLLSLAPTKHRGVSTASVKAGAVLRIALHPEDLDFAVSGYRALTLLRFEDTHPAVAAFGRRLLSSRADTPDEVLLLAYRSFDSNHGDKCRAYMKDIEPVRADLRHRANLLMARA